VRELLPADQSFTYANLLTPFRNGITLRRTYDTLNDLPGSVLDLHHEIVRTLDEEPARGVRLPHVELPPLPPRAMRLELARRIEATAEVIRVLRINSVSESVDELIAIADELKKSTDESNPSRLKEAGDKAFRVLFVLLDELSTQPGIRMALTGAIALLVGGTGASGAIAFGAGLSSGTARRSLRSHQPLGKAKQPSRQEAEEKVGPPFTL
jgi:hypothetical protein